MPFSDHFFQTFDTEIEPVLPYLSGRVLNAGCGNRDITGTLTEHKATAVDNCDIASEIPGAVLCDLTAIPQPAASYDSIFCNAVLEHVQFCDATMAEFHRLLKPGGHLVLCIPFLQPFHASPTDFRRFTRDGMVELGRTHGFETVEVLPVHSMAQTITWIVWALLTEKRRHLTRLAVCLPLLLWCKLSKRTDFGIRENANAFQIVLRVPSAGAAATN
ncbi:MAG TPA: class I SAM-dependent methyltransferase [Pirellulales bacterium]|jgi:SAM-dependent methyltransferase|nr:class I SAM-dependent methyltransferase [Pirellulales bacterium]